MRIIIIGAGHNGLTAAFYLARAGFQPVVIERRSIVGGAAVTEALAPGFRCPTLSHTTGPMRASIVRDMRLAERGVEFIRPATRLMVLSPDGRALALSADEGRTAQAVRPFSAADADKYGSFCASLSRLGGFLAPLLESSPPSLNERAAGELWEMLKIGRRFRALGRVDGYRLLRWMPMAAADVVSEWFTSDLLQAAIAARGIFGATQGPRSAGTGALLLMNAAVDQAPGGSSVTVKGGPGKLTAAMADAAREAGAEIRTGLGVSRVIVTHGRASGVLLQDGTEVDADAVVSGADPKQTFLGLLDPIELDPGFLAKVRNYRAKGAAAKINLALSALPRVQGVEAPDELGGRIQIGPDIDYLERAYDASKYGDFSSAPYLDITIPSLQDPSLAPANAHVMSIYMQYAPYLLSNGRSWETASEALARSVLETLERYAPGIDRLVVQRQVLTPPDLERTYGLTGGHIFHGEPSLDQLFTMRPILGWAQYRTPIERLYLCGAGTHPGVGVTGGSGQNAAREIIRALKR